MIKCDLLSKYQFEAETTVVGHFLYDDGRSWGPKWDTLTDLEDSGFVCEPLAEIEGMDHRKDFESWKTREKQMSYSLSTTVRRLPVLEKILCSLCKNFQLSATLYLWRTDLQRFASSAPFRLRVRIDRQGAAQWVIEEGSWAPNWENSMVKAIVEPSISPELALTVGE